MLKECQQYIDEFALFSQADRILLGVSGGVDSVVMLDLLYQSGYRLGIAHCNFQLRGRESEEDHRFVARLAQTYDLPFYEKRFPTKEYAKENGLSIQMAARELRFDWFEQLRNQKGYQVTGIAHNKNDSIETALINLTRGTGLKGITGIQPKSGNVVRPVLFATREEIVRYSSEQGLAYREDSSNKTVKYSRNRIRHTIIPEYQTINSQFLETMSKNIDRFREIHRLYEFMIANIRERIMRKEGRTWKIDIEQLAEYPGNSALLYELLAPFNFSGPVISDIHLALENESGKVFYSSSHKAVKDRGELLITPLEAEEHKRYNFDLSDGGLREPVKLDLTVVPLDESFTIPNSPDVASIDYDMVEFPLILRKWQAGDYFKPLGMGHYKKLSDYLIDRKYSLVDKEQTWLLTSGERIVWIVGDRLDDRFKISTTTKQVVLVTYYPED